MKHEVVILSNVRAVFLYHITAYTESEELIFSIDIISLIVLGNIRAFALEYRHGLNSGFGLAVYFDLHAAPIRTLPDAKEITVSEVDQRGGKACDLTRILANNVIKV